MNITQEQLKQSILKVAERLNITESIKALFDASYGFPSIVKIIGYEIFVQDYIQYFEPNNDLFNDVILIREYCNELDNEGFVVFK